MNCPNPFIIGREWAYQATLYSPKCWLHCNYHSSSLLDCIQFFKKQRAPSRLFPFLSSEGNHLLETVSQEQKNHSGMTKAWRICSEKFPKYRSLGASKLNSWHSVSLAPTHKVIWLCLLINGQINLNPFKRYYFSGTQEYVVSLLSLLKSSVSLVVTDKDRNFSKSITQNKELKSILTYLWEADLH